MDDKTVSFSDQIKELELEYSKQLTLLSVSNNLPIEELKLIRQKIQDLTRKIGILRVKQKYHYD